MGSEIMQGLTLRMPEREEGVNQFEHHKHAERTGQDPDRRPKKDERPRQWTVREPNIEGNNLQATDKLSRGRCLPSQEGDQVDHLQSESDRGDSQLIIDRQQISGVQLRLRLPCLRRSHDGCEGVRHLADEPKIDRRQHDRADRGQDQAVDDAGQNPPPPAGERYAVGGSRSLASADGRRVATGPPILRMSSRLRPLSRKRMIPGPDVP